MREQTGMKERTAAGRRSSMMSFPELFACVDARAHT